MKSLSALLALALATIATAAAPAALPDGLYAEFVTPRGTVTAELFYQRTPLTVASFVGLAEGTLGPRPGNPFFNGLKFHRVVPNFVVQGGDPLGTGEGDPGYSFPDEFVPGLRHDAAGMLSMANDGPDTNGSQFFFTLREVNRLNYMHSVFGRVVTGVEVLPQIKQDDLMTEVRILRVGDSAKAFRADRATFDALATKTKRFSAAAVAGPTTYFDDPDKVLPTDPPRALGFQRKLANFERATGQKVYARILAHFEPETPKQMPGRVAESVAKKIGLPPASALAIYFADTGQWALWFGDDYLPQFTGASREALPEMMRSGGLHRAKQDFLAAAKAEADLATADYIAHAAPDKPITPGQRIKIQIDAVLDALLFKFEPKS